MRRDTTLITTEKSNAAATDWVKVPWQVKRVRRFVLNLKGASELRLASLISLGRLAELEQGYVTPATVVSCLQALEFTLREMWHDQRPTKTNNAYLRQRWKPYAEK